MFLNQIDLTPPTLLKGQIIKLQMSHYLWKLSTRLSSAGSSPSLITSWFNVIVHTPSLILGKGGLWKKKQLNWNKPKLTPSSTSSTFHSFCKRFRFARENLFLLPISVSVYLVNYRLLCSKYDEEYRFQQMLYKVCHAKWKKADQSHYLTIFDGFLNDR